MKTREYIDELLATREQQRQEPVTEDELPETAQVLKKQSDGAVYLEYRACGDESCPWLQTAHGFSAHASQDRLLEYARHVSPEAIALIHGPDYTQTQLAAHFARNVESIEQVTRSRLLTPIPVTRDAEVATLVLSPDRVAGSSTDVREQIEHLREFVAILSEEVDAARTDSSLLEADVRKIVRDERE